MAIPCSSLHHKLKLPIDTPAKCITAFNVLRRTYSMLSNLSKLFGAFEIVNIS